MCFTASSFVRRAVVKAVVDAIADVLPGDAAAVVARELAGGVAGPEEAADLVAPVSAVVVVVAAIVVGHTAPVATGEHGWLTGVEGCIARRGGHQEGYARFHRDESQSMASHVTEIDG